MSDTLTSVGSPAEVKEQIRNLLGTSRLRIFVQIKPKTYAIVNKQIAQIINPVHFKTYPGIPVLGIVYRCNSFERVSIGSDDNVSLVIHQYQTIEAALWYMVIVAMEILSPEAPREAVDEVAQTLSKDTSYKEELGLILATNAILDHSSNIVLPLPKLVFSNQ